ncbi:MAG TPA: ATP-binding protein [Planctomicrobium sp.]|nr:ATP-binding protein [Planctomicrobium sp.]
MSENTSPIELDRDRARLLAQYNEIASLAGGLAHEVRNPLSTIRLNLELLLEEMEEIEHPSSHRILRKLKTIQSQCGHLEEILDAFLQFARAGEFTLEENNLAPLIRESVENYKPLAEQQRVDIRPHLASDLPLVQVDRRLLRQAFDNLFRNALEAMPDGGLIEIQAYARDGLVVIEFIDTGKGIPATVLPKIFQEFYSTKSSGSGLGLPTVRKIIESHGGTIQCESEPGRGTRFTLTLPVSSLLPS